MQASSSAGPPGEILVLSAAAGAGHVSAAEALTEALRARAADLFVGKAGGLSSSEALARGLVLVIVNPIPGQEERNADHFLEEGVAIRCNTLATLSWKISALLEDGARLDQMRENVARLRRPDAAARIASIVLGDTR